MLARVESSGWRRNSGSGARFVVGGGALSSRKLGPGSARPSLSSSSVSSMRTVVEDVTGFY